jgi:hypothetical protein
VLVLEKYCVPTAKSMKRVPESQRGLSLSYEGIRPNGTPAGNSLFLAKTQHVASLPAGLELLKGRIDEPTKMPAINKLEREFTDRVVSAWQRNCLEVDLVFAEQLHYVL